MLLDKTLLWVFEPNFHFFKIVSPNDFQIQLFSLKVYCPNPISWFKCVILHSPGSTQIRSFFYIQVIRFCFTQILFAWNVDASYPTPFFRCVRPIQLPFIACARNDASYPILLYCLFIFWTKVKILLYEMMRPIQFPFSICSTWFEKKSCLVNIPLISWIRASSSNMFLPKLFPLFITCISRIRWPYLNCLYSCCIITWMS